MRARLIKSMVKMLGDQRGNALLATTLALPVFIGAGAAAIDGALWYMGQTALKEAAGNAAYSAAAAKTEAEAQSAAETIFLAGSAKYGELKALDIAFSKKDNRDVADLTVQTLLKLPVSGVLMNKGFLLSVRVSSSNLDRTTFLQPSGDGAPPSLVVTFDESTMVPTE